MSHQSSCHSAQSNILPLCSSIIPAPLLAQSITVTLRQSLHIVSSSLPLSHGNHHRSCLSAHHSASLLLSPCNHPASLTTILLHSHHCGHDGPQQQPEPLCWPPACCRPAAVAATQPAAAAGRVTLRAMHILQRHGQPASLHSSSHSSVLSLLHRTGIHRHTASRIPGLTASVTTSPRAQHITRPAPYASLLPHLAWPSSGTATVT
jgi:hypothetical protein